MIPKIIHRFWICENNNFNPIVKHCIKSQEKLRDYGYQINTYDDKNFDMSISNFLKQAYALKKYSPVSDYIRIYLLYHYGGIWLDYDVEVYKSFNKILNAKYFLSYEWNKYKGIKNYSENNPNLFNETTDKIEDYYAIDTGVMGFEKHNIILKNILDYYDSIDFVDDKLNVLDNLNYIVGVFLKQTIKKLNLKEQLVSSNLNDYIQLTNNELNNTIYILNTKWFTYYPYNENNNYLDDVICVHRRCGTWFDETYNKQNLNNYPKKMVDEYYSTINKLTLHNG